MEQESLDIAQNIAEAFYEEHAIFFWLLGTCATAVAAAVPAILIPMWIRVSRLLAIDQSIHKSVADLVVKHNLGSTLTINALTEIKEGNAETTKVLRAVSQNLLNSDTTLKSLAGLIEKEQDRREAADLLDRRLQAREQRDAG